MSERVEGMIMALEELIEDCEQNNKAGISLGMLRLVMNRLLLTQEKERQHFSEYWN